MGQSFVFMVYVIHKMKERKGRKRQMLEGISAGITNGVQAVSNNKGLTLGASAVGFIGGLIAERTLNVTGRMQAVLSRGKTEKNEALEAADAAAEELGKKRLPS